MGRRSKLTVLALASALALVAVPAAVSALKFGNAKQEFQVVEGYGCDERREATAGVNMKLPKKSLGKPLTYEPNVGAYLPSDPFDDPPTAQPRIGKIKVVGNRVVWYAYVEFREVDGQKFCDHEEWESDFFTTRFTYAIDPR